MTTPWDKIGQKIDSFVADNIEIAWPTILEHLKNIKSESHILDYGCGTGALCRELHNRNYVVIGVDTSGKILEIARKKSPREIKYIQGDQETLKRYKGTLDAITSVMVLQFIENVEQLAIRMFTSLNKDGILSITVFNPDFVLRCAGQFFKELKKSKNYWKTKSQFNGVVIDTYIRNEAQYKKIFENAGFTFCSSQYPSFTEEFLKKYDWQLPSDVPEYLIMKFKK